MDFFSILTLIGGLALFLYGMNVMGDGLAKVSGGKMERILETLTSNPLNPPHSHPSWPLLALPSLCLPKVRRKKTSA